MEYDLPTSTQPSFPPNDTLPDTSQASTTIPGYDSTLPLVDIRAIKKARNLRLRALSKTFGDIPGVSIFTHWNSRVECSDSAVHRHTVAGIHGNEIDGTYSLTLSNLYKDNEDGGDIIIYTGAGGRKKWSDSIPPKRLRVGPQIMDQSWELCRNGALITSLDTGNPVRVVRSSRSHSRYAPLKGYRYDGLYKVAACWTAKGHNGKDICRCRLERLPDQPPIPLRPITIYTGRKRRRISHHHSVTADAEPDTTEGIQSGSSLADLSTNSGEESSIGFSDPPQQRAVSEASTLINFNVMGEAEQGAKVSPQPPPEHCAPYPATVPSYRWDSETNELVRVDPQLMPEDFAAADEEEPFLGDISIADDEEEGVDEHRIEDDVMLLPPGADNSASAIDFRPMEGEF